MVKIPSTFQWVAIVVLILVIFALVKIRYIKHKLSWIIIISLLLIFYIGFLASTSGQNINFNTYEGSKAGINLYLAWLSQSFENLKVLTGQAVKLDWGANVTTIKKELIP